MPGNLIILGTGRSGTSFAASLFKDAGYFFGDDLLEPTSTNPKGFYEDKIVNAVNTYLVRRELGWRDAIKPPLGFWIPKQHKDGACLWLASPKRIRSRKVQWDILAIIKSLMTHVPFCYKDPRFSVTFPSWKPHLPDNTRMLVVFRDPKVTAQSILRQATENRTHTLPIDIGWSYRHWLVTYQRILHSFADGPNWLFVDYEAMLDGSALKAIGRFSDAELDVAAADPKLNRSQPDQSAPAAMIRKCEKLYDQLRKRAEDDIARLL